MANTSRCGTAAVLGTAAGVLIWSTLIERRLFTVRRHEVPVLPTGASPVRVLQLSDLHLAPWQTNKINWVRSLAALRPDLLVLTGDLMGHVQARPALLHTLEAFSGTPAVFVHGSNDYYGPVAKNPIKYLREPSRLSTNDPDIDNDALTKGLEGLGFTDLNNSVTEFELRGTRFEMLGLGDPHIQYDDVEQMRAALANLGTAHQGDAVTPDSARATDNAANQDGARNRESAGSKIDDQGSAVRVGVVHAPYQAALGALLDDGAELLLAGHTHGGQVRVPGIGALTSNCDLPTQQARGLSAWHNAHRAAYLNVSAGLGNSIYAPVRFACRPEATLLTLTAAGQ